MKRFLLVLIAIIFAFTIHQSAYALTITADPGAVGLSPQDMIIAIPSGAAGSDLDSYLVEFVDDKYISLLGISTFTLFIDIYWNDPIIHTGLKSSSGLDLLDNYGNSLGFFSQSGSGSTGEYHWTETATVSNVYISSPFFALNWIPSLDVINDYGSSNTVLSGTLTIEMSQVNGVVGASAPVPEPATFLLLGSGIIGFGGLRRKMKCGKP